MLELCQFIIKQSNNMIVELKIKLKMLEDN